MRKYFPAITAGISALGMIVLILDAETALSGAAAGIALCIQTVIPSLFPFFLFSILLTGSLTGAAIPGLSLIGRMLRLPSGSESIFLAGLLGGYPVGAQCIAQSSRSGSLSKKDGERMMAFCVNAGPAFIFGVGATIFQNPKICWLVWAIHILSAIIVGILTPGSGNKTAQIHKSQIETIPSALKKAVQTMAIVCGWVVLFRILLAFMDRWFLWLLPKMGQNIVYGLIELSNGCCSLINISSEAVKFTLFTSFLNLGGFCVAMQTISVISGSGIRGGYYLPGKVLQTIIGLLLCQLVQMWLWRSFQPEYIMIVPVCIGICIIYRFLAEKSQKSSSIPKKFVV